MSYKTTYYVKIGATASKVAYDVYSQYIRESNGSAEMSYRQKMMVLLVFLSLVSILSGLLILSMYVTTKEQVKIK